MTAVRPWSERPAAHAAGAAGVFAYAWWATRRSPFATTATLAVVGAGLVAVSVGQARPPQNESRPARAGAVRWVVVLVALAGWHLLAYVQQPRSEHPTLSSLTNSARSRVTPAVRSRSRRGSLLGHGSPDDEPRDHTPRIRRPCRGPGLAGGLGPPRPAEAPGTTTAYLCRARRRRPAEPPPMAAARGVAVDGMAPVRSGPLVLSGRADSSVTRFALATGMTVLEAT